MNLKVQKDYQNLKGKLNNMSDKIADWLILQKAITTDERELYAYAVHCLFSLLYPIVFASVIGAFLGMITEAIAMIMPFILIRKFSGGYHADSFKKCLVLSSIVIIVTLLIGKYIKNIFIVNIMYIAATILLMVFSPIDSVNKRLDDNDKKFCKKVTIFIVAVIFGVVGVLWIIGYRYYTVFIESGIILAELLQLVAICHNMIFNENDYVIFTSSSGRSLEGFMYTRTNLSLQNTTSLLITQNPTYARRKLTTDTIQVPGRFDGINFNYQIMTIFDLIRVMYYQKYIENVPTNH